MKLEVNKIKRWLFANRIELIFFAIYLIITFAAILFHENWEDEAQAWLTARDCSPLELIGRMKYEGHFLPWYFIIMPFAKLGLPFKTINFISWVICGFSAWLMLKYLPFKKYKRVLLIFTLPMIYLYPVIARCYCLIPLATILLIMFYKNRYSKPIPYLLSIILLANTHIYCFVFAFILGVEFIIDWLKVSKKLKREENKKIFIYITATVIITALTYLPLLGNNSPQIKLDISQFNFLHLFVGDPVITMSVMSSTVPIAIVYVLVSIAMSHLAIYRFSSFFKLSISIMWQFFIFDCLFTMLLPQRAFIPLFFLIIFLARKNPSTSSTEINLFTKITFSILLLILVILSGSLFCEILTFVFCIWSFLPLLVKKINFEIFYSKIFSFSLILLAVISIGESIVRIKWELAYHYSEAYTTANFIKQELSSENESLIFITDTKDAIAISPVIAMMDDPNFKIYDINYDTPITYDLLFYKQSRRSFSAEDAKKYCNNSAVEESRCYYISNYERLREVLMRISSDEKTPIEQLVDDGVLELLYDSSKDNEVDWEQAPTEHYRIYKILSTQ